MFNLTMVPHKPELQQRSVDPASGHMLVSKIKPCMSQFVSISIAFTRGQESHDLNGHAMGFGAKDTDVLNVDVLMFCFCMESCRPPLVKHCAQEYFGGHGVD